MKIGQIENKAATSPAVAERKQPPETTKTASPATTEASAQVELSSGALGVDGVDPVFDAEKVQRISDAIREGRFEINAEAIADKLIANAHDLLSPQSRG
ncbi:MAG: flagellar biosynthesis anti-sigma factor FlgM [Burkholderiaceae bacterium]|jgi:negative regulator of flagellin synthesis FlgM|nr:flagellar biosynthesis anti-sigma factor FlgM [Aquabacterium sp.]NUP86422.1 flagellar biosynthesis anti-sigma factor FlgM [Burkholderiaceae bacterium]